MRTLSKVPWISSTASTTRPVSRHSTASSAAYISPRAAASSLLMGTAAGGSMYLQEG